MLNKEDTDAHLESRPALRPRHRLGLGVVYLIVAGWGFALGDGAVILDIVPVNSEDNVLHLLIGAVGVIAGLASSTRTASVSRAAA